MKSLRLCNEFKAVIGRNFLSGPMLVSFQSINRFYLYHHILYNVQVFFLHTFLSSEIIRYIDGNFAFSVRFGKFTIFLYYFEFLYEQSMCSSGLVGRARYLLPEVVSLNPHENPKNSFIIINNGICTKK